MLDAVVGTADVGAEGEVVDDVVVDVADEASFTDAGEPGSSPPEHAVTTSATTPIIDAKVCRLTFVEFDRVMPPPIEQ